MLDPIDNKERKQLLYLEWIRLKRTNNASEYRSGGGEAKHYRSSISIARQPWPVTKLEALGESNVLGIR